MANFGPVTYGVTAKGKRSIIYESKRFPGCVYTFSFSNDCGKKIWWTCNGCRAVKQLARKTTKGIQLRGGAVAIMDDHYVIDPETAKHLCVPISRAKSEAEQMRRAVKRIAAKSPGKRAREAYTEAKAEIAKIAELQHQPGVMNNFPEFDKFKNTLYRVRRPRKRQTRFITVDTEQSSDYVPNSEGHSQALATGIPEMDYGVLSSFDQSGTEKSPASKRIKRSRPAKKVNEVQPSDELAVTGAFEQENQKIPGANDANNVTQGGLKRSSPKKCADSVASNNDDILTALVRNQQLMLDAMLRLEGKLDNVHKKQFDFNLRFTTMKKQTNDVSRQIEKSCNTMETRLDKFIAVNNGHSSPVSLPVTSRIKRGKRILRSSAASRKNRVSAIKNAAYRKNRVRAVKKVAADIDADKRNSLSAARDAHVSYQDGELRQHLDAFCSSLNTPGSSSSHDVPYRRGNQLPGTKLTLDPNNPTIGWIGGNPDLPIPVSEYYQIWTKSGGTGLQLLFALLSYVYGGTESLKHLSWSGKDCRQPLKDDPAFASCAAQVSLQFPTFEMTSAVGRKVADRLSKLRSRRNLSSAPMTFEDGNLLNPTEFNVEDAFSFAEIPVTVHNE